MYATATAAISAPPPPSEHPEVDYLLARVAEGIQLTGTQYSKAEEHYRVIGEWLATGNPFARLKPRVFAQGSMALGTAIRPSHSAEYDVDVVFEVTGGEWTDARTLFHHMYDRLRDNGRFAPILSPNLPCARLEYRGDFHIDIIPAVRGMAGQVRPWVQAYDATGVLVPKADLSGWSPSNPEGFVQWFKSKSVAMRRDSLAKAHLKPLPEQEEAAEKAPLALAVQLVKRARDVAFDGRDHAPSSVILTTLAGQYYSGGESLIEIIGSLLRGIRTEIRAAEAGLIRVPNPTNPAENFAEHMTRPAQAALDSFAATFGSGLDELTRPASGLPHLKETMKNLFGEDPIGRTAVDSAIDQLGRSHKGLRDAGKVTYTPATGVSLVPSTSGTVSGSIRAPRNTNYGD